VATLECKFAEFGKLVPNPQFLKAFPIGLPEFRSGGILAMSMQFVGQEICNIDGHRTIKARVRDASGFVVVCDGLDSQVGDAPQSEEVSADLRV